MERFREWVISVIGPVKIATGFIFGVGAFIVTAVAAVELGGGGAASNSTSRWVNVLVLITATLLGWCGGILLTPHNSSEQKRFTEYGAAISTFLSGFVLAKVDRVFEDTFDDAGLLSDTAIARTLIFASGFLLGGLFTFISRLYVRPAARKSPPLDSPDSPSKPS
jgi:hypothetical protein